MKQIVINS